MLLLAVVVTRNRPGAHIDIGSDRRIAEVREMVGFGTRSENRLFQLDKVSYPRVLANVCSLSQVGKRTKSCAGRDTRLLDHAEVLDRHTIFER